MFGSIYFVCDFSPRPRHDKLSALAVNVSFLGILEFKMGIGLILSLHIVLISLQMLHSLRIHHSMHNQLHQILLLHRSYLFLTLNLSLHLVLQS